MFKLLHLRRLLPALFSLCLCAATLEKLSMDDLVTRSQRIVRARVNGSTSITRGPVIYTQYTLAITETLKGDGQTTLQVYAPGGHIQGRQQVFAGTPQLTTGQEYVLFLWCGKSGQDQIIGLSQGLFTLQQANGETLAVRAAADATVVDRTGRVLQDSPLVMKLTELRGEVSRRLGGRQ